MRALVDLQVVIADAGRGGDAHGALNLSCWGERGPEAALGVEACRWIGMEGIQPGLPQLRQLVEQAKAHQLPSLKSLCEATTGHTLDKRKQTSDWAKRPLDEAQIRYAALDALVLLRVYLALARAGGALRSLPG